jgi:hypothetical protein
MLAGYGWGLREFLRHPLSIDDCRRLVETQRRQRASNLLNILEHAVFASKTSPYRRLCEHAGIELSDVRQWVGADGVESALERLYEAGVHLRSEEFKGRQPVRRPGLELTVRPTDLDNPLLASAYRAETGGSRGAAARITIDLDLLSYDAAQNALADQALGLDDHVGAQWRPIPPASAALNNALRYARVGRGLERWFTQTTRISGVEGFGHALFGASTLWASRLLGNPLPVPEHVPPNCAQRIARWLVEQKRAGRSVLFDTFASSAVRICLAAQEYRLDIAGTVFRVGGEPFTSAKFEVVTRSDCRAISRYSLSEVGNVGLPCGATELPGAVHLISDKVAVLRREKGVGDSGETVGVLHLTTLLPASPKLLLNVETNDYGVLSDAPCGCPLYEAGLELRLHSIRSIDKLTSEGMTFAGSELLELIDEVLPARFGGNPTDYQLVEREVDGLPKVELVVSPSVGEIDPRAVAEVVLDALGSHHIAWRMAADQWRASETLRVVRREPHLTRAAKILPLHVLPGS